jgi:N-methylhydantoinase A
MPGPACYGHGGPVTVTDANVVLGRIVPELFLDGELPLDARASRAAMVRLGRAMGTNAEEAARGVLRVANATIERALRRISVERGHDVRGSALVAFGGAGPLHACELADALGMREVLVPPGAGVLSAWGLLGADERHDAAATLLWRIAPGAPWMAARARAAFAALRAELERRHGREGDARFEAVWRVRYRGQSFELDVPAGVAGAAGAAADPRAAFRREHERRFGYARPGEDVEIVQLDVTLVRRGPALPPERVRARTAKDARLGAHGRTALWRRERLGRDARVVGPAIVVEYGATTFLPARWRLALDARGNLRLARARATR